MTPERRKEIEEAGKDITEAEAESGWHFCEDLDDMLVGPGDSGLDLCTCTYNGVKCKERAEAWERLLGRAVDYIETTKGASANNGVYEQVPKALHDVFDQVQNRQQASTKETNPKDAVGSLKVGLSAVPVGVLLELGLALQEGSLKYNGVLNWRKNGARASVYYNAALRHLLAWWSGEDVDPDSGVSHLVKVMSSLAVLRDAQMADVMNDDRVTQSVNICEFNRRAKEMTEKVAGKRYGQ